MTKEEFIKELNKNLKYLRKKEREEEMIYYDNLDSYNLDPLNIANEIYKKRGLKITLVKKIKFFESINIIINNLQSKDKKIIKDIIFFFIYLLFFIIIIKIPFIYVRDIISNMFIETFKDNHTYTIWALFFELIYAFTSILVIIRMIKNKALKLQKEEH